MRDPLSPVPRSLETRDLLMRKANTAVPLNPKSKIISWLD